MNKHTPGPWKRFDGYGADYRKPVIVDSIPDQDGKCVANCICYVATTNDDWDANAKLIASAPALLAALTSLMDSHEAYAASEKNWPDWDEYDRMMYPRWLAAKELLERLKDD
jgi:hypothetical protein